MIQLDFRPHCAFNDLPMKFQINPEPEGLVSAQATTPYKAVVVVMIGHPGTPKLSFHSKEKSGFTWLQESNPMGISIGITTPTQIRTLQTMHSNPAQYDLIAPTTLEAVLQTLAENPGQYTPIAVRRHRTNGGPRRQAASRRKTSSPSTTLKELRFINTTESEVTIGSGTTLHRHPQTPHHRQSDFSRSSPQAASWTGSIANQNRGTLGGNIVNAFSQPPGLTPRPSSPTTPSSPSSPPAAPAPSALYADFHLGYKKTALAPDELLHSTSPSPAASPPIHPLHPQSRHAQRTSHLKSSHRRPRPHEQRPHRRHKNRGR